MGEQQSAVMVIDGNRVSLKFYAKLVDQHFKGQHRVLEVECGQDALYLCERQEIIFVLMAEKLPDMDYLTFLKGLKSQPRGDLVPVVIVTAEGDESSAVDAIKAGARDYLIKGSFSQEKLSRSVTHALTEVHLLKQVEKEISEREKVEENLRLFRDLMNQTMDVLFIADPQNGRLLDFNEASWTNLGYTQQQLKQVTMRDFLAGFEKPSAWQGLLKRIGEKGHHIHEGEIKRKDGSSYSVEVTIRYSKRGGNEYLVGVARNITNRKLMEAKLRDLSTRDGLTSLYNRRYFDENLKREWNRGKREGQVLSLILFDIDSFKKYNDSYGHQAGDACLQTISKFLTESFNRASEFSARYGGEEFVVVLPNTDQASAKELGNRFREGLIDLAIEHSASEAHRYVTVSLGLATVVPNEGSNEEALIKAADDALYRAKESGRNCLVVADL